MNNHKQEIKLKIETSNHNSTNVINDLTSELTIQRQNLKLKLEHLNELVGNLKQCASNLDLEYSDLNIASNTISKTQLKPHILQLQEIITNISFKLTDVDQTNSTLNRTAQHLQHSLLRTEMCPLTDIFERLKRALHDLTIEYNKPVQLQITGAETLVERSIIDTLEEPLLHILRNIFYHSIEDRQTRINLDKPEQGLIEISVTATQNNIAIIVNDDGCGRGVNIDFLRHHLNHIGGDMKFTQLAKGTQLITIPFNILISQVLFIELNSILLACPTSSVREVLPLTEEYVLLQAGQKYIQYQNTNIPLINLDDYLHFNYKSEVHQDVAVKTTKLAPNVLIVDYKNQAIAIQFNKCWSEEAVIRQVEGNISLPTGFSNCTIIGSGQVVPIVNWDKLLSSFNDLKQNIFHCVSQRTLEPIQSNIKNNTTKNDRTKNDNKTILVVDDSTSIRVSLARTLEKAGYQVEEASDGLKGIEKIKSGVLIKAVICDIDMPKLSGFGFLARVKAQPTFKHIPIILLTSHTGDKYRHLAFKFGAKAFLHKPYNEYELLKVLNE